jgi:microcystin-dependent protein
MSHTAPFLSELRIFSFNFAPRGWAQCSGQLLPINQNQALFSLLGTMYGGDGRVNFALPDLRGRVPVHHGGSFNQGQVGGEMAHTLTAAEQPAHSHRAQGSSANSDASNPAGNVLGAANNMYAPAGNLTALHPTSVSSVGGSQPHENMQPYLTLNICIALQGIFPSQA